MRLRVVGFAVTATLAAAAVARGDEVIPVRGGQVTVPHFSPGEHATSLSCQAASPVLRPVLRQFLQRLSEQVKTLSPEIIARGKRAVLDALERSPTFERFVARLALAAQKATLASLDRFPITAQKTIVGSPLGNSASLPPAMRSALARKNLDLYLKPNGKCIGLQDKGAHLLRGGEKQAEALFRKLTTGGEPVTAFKGKPYDGRLVQLPSGDRIGYRIESSASRTGQATGPTIEVLPAASGRKVFHFKPEGLGKNPNGPSPS